MTRDEAIEKLRGTRSLGQTTSPAEMLVDGLEALGLLKLEEPKRARARFIEAMLAQGYRHTSCMQDALDAFDIATR